MRLIGPVFALLILAACDSGKDESTGAAAARNQTVTHTKQTASEEVGSGHGDPLVSRGVGKIIDNVGAIKPERLNGISQELAEIDRLGGPQVTVVLVRPTSGESMEQLGWAIAGRPTGKQLVLLTDPETAVVRIEGALDSERKAQIAAVMQQQLTAKQPADAIQAAINILRGAS